MKPSLIKNNYFPYILLFIQPVFMSTNTIIARGGVEFVPPISLAFWRWFTVFIILFPFFFDEIINKKKEFKKETELKIHRDSFKKIKKKIKIKYPNLKIETILLSLNKKIQEF